MFFSANNVIGASSNVSLASLIGMNSANAEHSGGSFYRQISDCKVLNSENQYVDGMEICCSSGTSECRDYSCAESYQL